MALYMPGALDPSAESYDLRPSEAPAILLSHDNRDVARAFEWYSMRSTQLAMGSSHPALDACPVC